MVNAMTNRLCGGFSLVYQTKRTRGYKDRRGRFLCVVQKGIHIPKGQSRPKGAFSAQKGIFGLKGHAWPERSF